MRSPVTIELIVWLIAAQTGTTNVFCLSPHPFRSYMVPAKLWHSSDPALGQLSSLNQQESNSVKNKKQDASARSKSIPCPMQMDSLTNSCFSETSQKRVEKMTNILRQTQQF